MLTSLENSTVRDAGNGAHERNRTADLLLTMQMLYRLSYVGGDAGARQKPMRAWTVPNVRSTRRQYAKAW